MNNPIIEFEKVLIEKCKEILKRKRISRTEERIIADTIQLIQFNHGLNCVSHYE